MAHYKNYSALSSRMLWPRSYAWHAADNMQRERRAWTRNIEIAKKKHWKEFLDQASSGYTLWKAAKYAKPTDNHATIPPLKVAHTEYTTNEDKARVFLESFFPQRDLETTQRIQGRSNPQELPWKPITEQVSQTKASAGA